VECHSFPVRVSNQNIPAPNSAIGGGGSRIQSTGEIRMLSHNSSTTIRQRQRRSHARLTTEQPRPLHATLRIMAATAALAASTAAVGRTAIPARGRRPPLGALARASPSASPRGTKIVFCGAPSPPLLRLSPLISLLSLPSIHLSPLRVSLSSISLACASSRLTALSLSSLSPSTLHLYIFSSPYPSFLPLVHLHSPPFSSGGARRYSHLPLTAPPPPLSQRWRGRGAAPFA